MELSKFQRTILKKDDRYTRLSGLRKEASDEFEQHFEVFEDVVETSMRMYMSEGFKGVIQPKTYHHPVKQDPAQVIKDELKMTE